MASAYGVSVDRAILSEQGQNWKEKEDSTKKRKRIKFPKKNEVYSFFPTGGLLHPSPSQPGAQRSGIDEA